MPRRAGGLKQDIKMKKNYIYAVTTVIIWATSATLLKAMFASLPQYEILCVSSALSALFLLAVNVAKCNLKGSIKTPCNAARLLFLGVFGLFAYNALYYTGIGLMSAQEACILNYLWPIMLIVFSRVILGERLTAPKIFAVLSSFGGVIVLSLGDIQTGSRRLAGAVCCISAAACYGMFCVLNIKWNLYLGVTMMTVWGIVAAGSAVLGLLTEEWLPITVAALPGILWMGIAVNGFSYLIWALALNDSGDSSLIANLAYLTPFFSVVFSALFLGERITLSSACALLLIIGGVVVSQLYGRR